MKWSELSVLSVVVLLSMFDVFGFSITTFGELAKFEPESGCYIGAFIERDTVAHGNIEVFEKLTGKKHASYFTYVGYGRPFPRVWAEKVKAGGSAPHIAWEPNDGLEMVRDDAYLREWAKQAAGMECPIFLRFASEMNGYWTAYHKDPALYIAKFRLVAKVMAQEAPNVAMVWTPFCIPTHNIHDYYPGDDVVDWVGVNIYSVYCHDGNARRLSYNEDPVDFLLPVYEVYAKRKPIQISEYAATHFCKGTWKDTTDFSIEKMTHFYRTLINHFPRVKMVNWLSFDSISAGVADNNYCLTDSPRLLAAYRKIIADPRFLSDVSFYGWLREPLASLTMRAERFHNDHKAQPVWVSWAEKGNPEPALWALGLLSNTSATAQVTLLAPRSRRRVSSEGITLVGIHDGDYLYRTTELKLQLPPGKKAISVRYRLDGRTIKITNVPPFRLILDPAELAAGTHTLQALVNLSDGRDVKFPPVNVEVVK